MVLAEKQLSIKPIWHTHCFFQWIRSRENCTGWTQTQQPKRVGRKLTLFWGKWMRLKLLSYLLFCNWTSGENSLHWSRWQHSKFTSAVGKCRGFCQGISPFYSICLSNKNAEAVKLLEIFLKNSFPRTKKEIFCKRKKVFMCIYIHYSYLHFVHF